VPLLLKFLHEYLPDLLALAAIERWIVEWDMDARDEGIIECTHSISSEKNDTLIEFESTEKT